MLLHIFGKCDVYKSLSGLLFLEEGALRNWMRSNMHPLRAVVSRGCTVDDRYKEKVI